MLEEFILRLDPLLDKGYSHGQTIKICREVVKSLRNYLHDLQE